MDNKTPHITVCLSAYNAERFAPRAIESILAQTYPHFSLYLVNDASTDNTLKMMKKFLSDPRVAIVNMSQNVGTYAAKNLILKNFAEGEYWAQQDADDWSEPARFEKELSFLQEKNLDGCGTAVDEIYCDGIVPRIPSDEPLLFNEDDQCSHRLTVYPETVTHKTISVDIDDLAKLKIAKNGSLFMRLDCMRALGGFDGRTHTGADSDLLWRWALFFSFGNVPEMLYHRRFHKDSLTQRPATGWDSENRKIYAAAALLRHTERLALLALGDEAGTKEKAAQDLYYPDVPFEIIRGKNIII